VQDAEHGHDTGLESRKSSRGSLVHEAQSPPCDCVCGPLQRIARRRRQRTWTATLAPGACMQAATKMLKLADCSTASQRNSAPMAVHRELQIPVRSDVRCSRTPPVRSEIEDSTRGRETAQRKGGTENASEQLGVRRPWRSASMEHQRGSRGPRIVEALGRMHPQLTRRRALRQAS